jgi:hypothetical protein
MPAHDAEKYVSRAIASVLNQSITDFEVIVVDDASTDSTAAIVQGFNDRRVRYSRVQHQAGPGGARNEGLRLARGPYAAFLDADDVAYRHRLAAQLAYMEARPKTALLGAGYDVIDAEDAVLNTITLPNGTASVRLKMLFDNVVATSLAFARRDVLLELGAFDERLRIGEDHDMWGRVASRYPIARLPEVLGAYRQHAGGTYSAGSGHADATRARVVRRVLRDCIGLDVSLGAAGVLGIESKTVAHSLDDSITALTVLELLPLGAMRLWADSASERRAMMGVWLDKISEVVSKEPRLYRHGVWIAASALLDGPPQDVWTPATLRSVLHLALPATKRLPRRTPRSAIDSAERIASKAHRES